MKNYNTFSNAAKMMLRENPTVLSDASKLDVWAAPVFLYEALEPHLKIQKRVGWISGNWGNENQRPEYIPTRKMKKLNRTNVDLHQFGYYPSNIEEMFVLEDGTVALIGPGGGDKTNFGASGRNAVIIFDVTGPKGPNIVGRDLFYLFIDKNGVVPAGIENNSANCSTESTSTYAGSDCAARLVRERGMKY